MRVTLVISSLGGGGAERTMSWLASALDADGHDVALVTFAPPEHDFYRVADTVRRAVIGDASPDRSRAAGIAKRVSGLRSHLRREQPDVALSFMDMTNVLSLAAAAATKVPVAVAERIDPRMQPLPAYRRWLRRLAYRRARAVVVQTEAAAAWARSFLPADRVFVIPNAIPAHRATFVPDGSLRLVAAGRLHPQKGFDLLIEAFSRISTRHPGWTLDIFGEGPGRQQLSAQIQRAGLDERVHLRGLTTNLRDELAGADVFALSSRYEGFPNVLLEAMSVGLAVVSFDCPSGPGEIVRHMEDGILVPCEDTEALATALDELVSDEKLRRLLGGRALAVGDRFSEDAIFARWLRLLQQVAGVEAKL